MKPILRVAMRALGLVAVLVMSAGQVHANYAYAEWADELGIDMQASYSATRVMQTSEGTVEFQERHSGGNARMDFAQDGFQGAVIMRMDEGKAYVLMPQMGMYQVTSLDEAMARAGGETSLTNVTEVGDDTVDGHDTTKFRATFRDKSGSGEGFVWVTQDTGIPIRMDMTYKSGSDKDQRIIMFLRKLLVEPQPADAFVVPSNLQPMNLGGFGLGGQGGDPSEMDEEALMKQIESLRKRFENMDR